MMKNILQSIFEPFLKVLAKQLTARWIRGINYTKGATNDHQQRVKIGCRVQENEGAELPRKGGLLFSAMNTSLNYIVMDLFMFGGNQITALVTQ